MGKFDVQSLLKIMQGDGVSTLSAATKSDEAKVNTVLTNALPVLVGKMSDNASSPDGAASLNKALNEHKTGDVIDVASFLKNADSEDGEKILDHILGSDKDAMTKALSKKSGLSLSKVSSILSLVAPLLLSQLGNNKKDDDASGLGSLLSGMLGGSSSSGGSVGSALLGSLLGGSSSSSSSGLGSLLGGLFGGSQEEEKEEQKEDSSLLGGLLGNLFGGKEEEKEEKKDDSSLLGGLGSLAMNLFGNSDAVQNAEEEKKTGKKTAAKKTAKKTGTSTAKKTGAKKTTSSSAKKTGTSTAKKTTAKKATSSTAKKTGTKKTATKKTTNK